MKRIIPILVAILIIIMGYFIYKAITQPERIRLEVNLSDVNNTVINQSSIPYLDTLAHIGLQGLKVEGIILTLLDIKPQHQINLLDGEVVNGFVSARSKGDILLFLNPNLKEGSIITYLSHELVHVHQVHTGKLWVMGNDIARWDGKIVNVNDWPYLGRPWEVDAFKRQVRVSSHIYREMYE